MGGAGMAGGVSGTLGAMNEGMQGILSADAANRAGKQQSRALDKIIKYTNENMDPTKVNEQAIAADQERARNRLALQAEIDPSLATARTVSEQKLLDQLNGIGSAESDKVAAATAKEALAGTPGMEEIKRKLIDSALEEINLGAKLPSDVQAELMQAGLQRTGQTTGNTNAGQGSVGSSILNQVLGTAGLNLRAQRQTQAAALATSAGNLEKQRQDILQNLFPRLQAQQMGNMQATTNVFQTADQALPQVGLSGGDVANIWLSRVGAINSLSAQKSQVQTQAALANAAGKAQTAGSFFKAAQSWAGGGMMGGGSSASPTGAGFTSMAQASDAG